MGWRRRIWATRIPGSRVRWAEGGIFTDESDAALVYPHILDMIAAHDDGGSRVGRIDGCLDRLPVFDHHLRRLGTDIWRYDCECAAVSANTSPNTLDRRILRRFPRADRPSTREFRLFIFVPCLCFLEPVGTSAEKFRVTDLQITYKTRRGPKIIEITGMSRCIRLR